MILPDFPTKERMRERPTVFNPWEGGRRFWTYLKTPKGPPKYTQSSHFSLEEPPSFPARLGTVTLARTQPLREPG